jgi:hypothetical protein
MTSFKTSLFELFLVPKIKPMTSCMLGKHSTTELHPQDIFKSSVRTLVDSSYKSIIEDVSIVGIWPFSADF